MKSEKLINVLKKEGFQNQDLVREAFDFAKLKHEGQKRLTGEEYLIHPFTVAMILATLGMDETTIAAGLLHDVIEDTETTEKEIREKFGNKVAELVVGVTKLGTIDFSKLPEYAKDEVRHKHDLENLRRFFLAMAKDVRVVIIKLADRLHNMRTLEVLKPADRKRISRETIEIFAPLADRLGMGSMKSELEDLAFKYLEPKEYERIREIVESGEKERKHYLNRIKSLIAQELKSESVKATIDGRVKHLYSVYNKLQKVNGDVSKIYDLLAIRVIVDSVEDCYKTLGIIHKHFKPLIYRIKDYISVPKPNGYQSLHTTVFGIEGRITEIQIRTAEMHEEAERGVAAHWYYSETKKEAAYNNKTSFAPSQMSWVNRVADWQNNITSDEEFTESLRIDLFNDRIFVFSPKGEVFDLPEGATPVDFAYEIHSAIGSRCRGAKVNGRMVTLDYRLENRDMVEIILAPKNDKAGPNRGWLDFVKTAKAKQSIRSFFKKQNRDVNIEEGKKLLISELALLGITEADLTEEQIANLISESSWRTWEDVLAAIGDGTTTARQIIKKIIGQRIYLQTEARLKTPVEESTEERDSYSNLSGILVRYAACCNPKAGDNIMGFITQGQGITIHKSDCPNLLASPKEKIISIDFEIPKTANVKIEVIGTNRVGFIRDVSSVISGEQININTIQNEHSEDPGRSTILVDIALDKAEKLADLLHKLTNVEGVITVRKR